jgi:hypothetical protein
VFTNELADDPSKSTNPCSLLVSHLTPPKRTYDRFSNIEVEPLRISEGNLNTKRMLDLMAVSNGDGPMPLYLHAVYRILREMRLEQQETGTAFSYTRFKERVALTAMTPAQLGPLTQRLETLESFMPNTQTGAIKLRRKSKAVGQHGNDWASKVCLARGNILSLRSDESSRVASRLLICRAHA